MPLTSGLARAIKNSRKRRGPQGIPPQVQYLVVGGGAGGGAAERGGGGGGAGEGGGNADGSSLPTRAPAHVGGDGLSISWLPPSYGTTEPSPGRWFAGGGGAGVADPSQPASSELAYLGGCGGGGTGSVSAPGSPGFSGTPKVSAIAATINTGSGGGGAARYDSGSSGGSGICAIRYPDSYEDASSITGSGYEFIQTGGYKIYVFTSAGSIVF
jgi:hypothetical protein